MFRTLVLLLTLGIAATAATFSVTPANPNGPPGSTVQLGFSITNTTDYLLVTGSGYCLGAPALPVCTASAIATYTDVIGSNFVVVGPAPELTTVSEPGGPTTGLGHLTFLNNAAGIESGTFYISYELYSVSPNDQNFDSVTDLIAVGQFLTAATQLTATTAIPEPSTMALSGLALAGIAVLRLRRN